MSNCIINNLSGILTLKLRKKQVLDICKINGFSTPETIYELTKLAEEEGHGVIEISGPELESLRKGLARLKLQHSLAKRKSGSALDKFDDKNRQQTFNVRLSSVTPRLSSTLPELVNTAANCNETPTTSNHYRPRRVEFSAQGTKGNQKSVQCQTSEPLPPPAKDCSSALFQELALARAEVKRLRHENIKLSFELYKAKQKEKRRKERLLPKESYSRRHVRRIRAQILENVAKYGVNLQTSDPAGAADVSRVTGVVDENNISMRKYSRLAALTPALPRKHVVEEHQKR